MIILLKKLSTGIIHYCASFAKQKWTYIRGFQYKIKTDYFLSFMLCGTIYCYCFYCWGVI